MAGTGGVVGDKGGGGLQCSVDTIRTGDAAVAHPTAFLKFWPRNATDLRLLLAAEEFDGG